MPPSSLSHRVAVEAGGDPLLGGRRSGSMSPAICSIVNWSNGMSPLSASITQSRYGQIAAAVVLLVAVGVGVAGQVEPRPRPALAVVRRREQPIDDLARRRRATVSARNASTSSGVGGRPIRSSVTRRSSVGLRRFGRRRQLLLLEPRQHEPSIGLRGQLLARDRGRVRPDRPRRRPSARGGSAGRRVAASAPARRHRRP